MSAKSAAADALAQPTARRFRVFISYASEDYPVAEAIRKCLNLALGDMAEVNIDRRFLQPGIDFKKQIQSKLRITNALIIVFTGDVEKESHGYTGWEVGYFDHIMEDSPEKVKVALYVHRPPAITASDQGIGLDIGRDKLLLSTEKFEAALRVSVEDPMCKMLTKWQESIDEITQTSGLGILARRPEQDPVTCVKGMKTDIFAYLKTTVDETLKPQKQITVRATRAALEKSDGNLPGDALIKPIGAGDSMAIFGLSDTEPITWERFLQKIAESSYHDSWREAITSVIMSSFPDHINVDNSQIIVSSDDSRAYRLILTTVIKYYNDNYDFNVYFVDMLKRPDYGDASTTLLLKGLELVCRFRFMFLEDTSLFSGGVILVTPPERIPEIASRLLKELNMLRKDSRDAGLDDPAKWRNFVSWDDLLEMAKEYRPREQEIRTTIGRIVQSKGRSELLVPMQRELATILNELQKKVLPLNTLLLKQMTTKLDELVPAVHAS
jgi:hypothetical protein